MTPKSRSTRNKNHEISFMTAKTEKDVGLNAVFWGVALCGAAFVIIAGATHGARALVGVSVGAALALANLWALGRLVRVYLYSDGLTWALVGMLKVAALFGVVFVVATRGLVDVGAMIIGYGALPAGIVATRLKPTPPPAAEEP